MLEEYYRREQKEVEWGERNNHLIVEAARFIIALHIRYQRKHGRFVFGVGYTNARLKKKGVRKDVRKAAWEMLKLSGLIIQHKESVALVPAIMRVPTKKRIKELPAPFIYKFKKLSAEVLGTADKEYSRIETLDILAKEKFKGKLKGGWKKKSVIELSVKVTHPIFGEGFIIEKMGDNIRIEFTDGQVKIFNYEKAKTIGLKEW